MTKYTKRRTDLRAVHNSNIGMADKRKLKKYKGGGKVTKKETNNANVTETDLRGNPEQGRYVNM
jgi:hypothetical protein